MSADDPDHYKLPGGIQVINLIDMLTTQCVTPAEGYRLGNVIKYLARYRAKGGVEDLRKAQVYLGWLIEEVEGDGDA